MLEGRSANCRRYTSMPSTRTPWMFAVSFFRSLTVKVFFDVVLRAASQICFVLLPKYSDREDASYAREEASRRFDHGYHLTRKQPGTTIGFNPTCTRAEENDPTTFFDPAWIRELKEILSVHRKDYFRYLFPLRSYRIRIRSRMPFTHPWIMRMTFDLRKDVLNCEISYLKSAQVTFEKWQRVLLAFAA